MSKTNTTSKSVTEQLKEVRLARKKELEQLETKWRDKEKAVLKSVTGEVEKIFGQVSLILKNVPSEHDNEVLKIKDVKKFLNRFGSNGKTATTTTKSAGAGKGVTDEQILEFLGEGEKSSKELQEKFGWTTSASVGQRMKPLIKADKVEMRQGEGTGRPKFYSLKK